MEQLKIKDLKNEELHFEYKKAKGGFPKSFWETYSAFANSYGGFIYLGVEENKRTYSLSNLSNKEIEDLKTILFNSLNNKEKVNVNLINDDDVEVIMIEDSLVLRVRVKECPTELRPIYINNNLFNGTYRRNGDGDYHCSVEEIKAMLRDSSNKSLDLDLLEEHRIDSADKESLNRYRYLFSSLHPNHPFLKESEERFLEFIGAARLNKNGEYRLTKAGLLMFGYSYRIVYEFTDYFLDYLEINDQNERWVDRVESNSGEWSGNVFSFFEKISYKLVDNIKKPFQSQGLYRNDDNYMIKSIREALCNTLCNADYYLPGGVVVKKYHSCIKFSNPGRLMMNIDQMLRGGTSLPRNKTLLKMFNLINIGERSGSGVPLLFFTSKEYNLPYPDIKDEFCPDRTSLTIFLNNDNVADKDLSSKEIEVLNYLERMGSSSAKSISEALNKNVTTIKLILYKLVEKNLISSTGTIKDKKYHLKK